MLVTQSILEQENKKESVEKEVLYFAYFLVKIECRSLVGYPRSMQEIEWKECSVK